MRHAVAGTGLMISAGLMLMSATTASAAARPVPEPPWPSQCPLKVGLLLDRSSSMADSFETVRSAASDMVDALREQPSHVMIVAFGTQAEVVRPLSDVSDADGRHAVKDAVEDLGAFGPRDDAGGTNWEDALRVAGSSGVQVVVMLTDGVPSTYGSPAVAVAEDDPAPLQRAVAVADDLKRAGTRLVPVGIGLGPGGPERLSAVSGPTQGDDYFVTDLAALRRQLYDITARSCGVPLTALPQPEAPGLPVAGILTAVGALLALLVGAGLVVSRRRDGPAAVGPRPPRSTPKRVGATAPIRLEGLTAEPSPPPASRGGSMSLDFLSDEKERALPEAKGDG